MKLIDLRKVEQVLTSNSGYGKIEAKKVELLVWDIIRTSVNQNSHPCEVAVVQR